MEPPAAASAELALEDEAQGCTVDSLPLTVLSKILALLPGDEVLRAAQVNRNFYAAASDVQQLRLELSATHDMQGSTEGQEHNFQRRVDSFLLWLERGHGPRLRVLAHGARLLHATAEAALASSPAAVEALAAWTAATNAAAVAATEAATESAAAAVAAAVEGRKGARVAAHVAQRAPFQMGPEAFRALAVGRALGPATSGGAAAVAGLGDWKPPLPNLQLLIVTERTAHAIQTQHPHGPHVWGVLCGAGAAARCVRVVGRVDGPLVACNPVLGPANTLWVPSLPLNAPGIAPICKLMGGPLLPWRARLVEISNSSMVRVNYIPPTLKGVQVAYPDCLVIKAPTLSFGRRLPANGGTETATIDNARHLCAMTQVRAVYNDIVSNEPTPGERAQLAAVMEGCRVGIYDDHGDVDNLKSEWTFWF